MNNRTAGECKNNFDVNDIKPTCIRILNAEDHDKSVISYDTEVYEGTNNSIVLTCLTIPQNPDICINISQISTSINLQQQHNPNQQVYSLTDFSTQMDSTTIMQMKLNLEKQQMDSGTNCNVTDDRHIIRNYSNI